jgi:glycosyltransferase involved in cell wall biosynthesis
MSQQRLVTRTGSELARRAAESGLTVVPARWSAGLDPRALARLVRAARQADILHAHDSHSVTLAAAAAAFTSRPFVATRRMTRPLRNAGPWRRAERVLAISGAVRQALIQSGVAEPAITVVPPGIDVAETATTKPVDWSGIPGIPPDAFIVIAVSALTAEKGIKGIDVLIDAMADSRVAAARIHCVIVGAGPETGLLALKASAIEPSGRVHFLGQVADPLPLIAAAGVLVMPSREEAFGSTILDALALGVPVIGANVGGIPEALAAGGGVTFPPEDAATLAGEMTRVSADGALRESLSRTGLAAAAHFDLRGMVDQTLAVYRSVMERVERQ